MAKEPTRRTFFRPHKRIQYTGVLDDGSFPVARVKQEFKRECDINNILKQYGVTGMLKHVTNKQQLFQDLPDSVDFQESLHTVEEARKAFMSLPSKLRARFDNEPALFLEFCSNPANLAEMRELGLAVPAVIPPATPPQEKKEEKPPE